MPVTVPERGRRRFLWVLAGLAACLPAAAVPGPVSSELAERLGDLAAALANGDAGLFLRHFDPRMEGFDQLANDLRSLVGVADVNSSVKPYSEEAEGARRKVQVEWSLQVKVKGPNGRVEERSRTVNLAFEKQGRKWKIVHFTPLNLFEPPVATAR